MELDNFYLALYDDTNIDHRTILIELYNDKYGKLYLGDLKYQMELIEKDRFSHPLNNAYIAYHNDIPIGYISIKNENDEYNITYGIRPKMRGEYLGALLLQEFSDKMFELNKDLDNLVLMIDSTNTGSIKTAKLVGYEKVSAGKYEQKRK